MRLLALNKDRASKYGYENELIYNKTSFNGHQLGLAIGVIRASDKYNITEESIIQNGLSDSLGDEHTKNVLLLELLNDHSIFKLEQSVIMTINDQMLPCIVFYLPYLVVNHSIYEPTANFSNIIYSKDVVNHVTVELLFVINERNRYVTYTFTTKDTSILHNIICNIDLTKIPDIQEHNGVDGSKEYWLDFYDEAGNQEFLVFHAWEQLFDNLISFRVLDVRTETEIPEDVINGVET